MPTNTSRATYDTYIVEGFPKTNYGNRGQIQLAVGTGNHKYAYVYFAGAPPHGATVFSATLSVWLRGSNWSTGGPYTITASRITDQWYESKLTWNRSSGGADHSTTHQASSAPISGGVDAQQVDIDVTGIMSDVAAGQGWYGIFLEVDASPAPGYLPLYSSESTYTLLRPRLSVVWSRPPDAPTDLAPSGGASVSVSKPVLKWVFKDPDGDAQAKYWVQVANDSAFTSLTYDSGLVTSADNQVDLSLTAYAGVSGMQYWRVFVEDVNGLASAWSSTASFTRTAKGSLSIANPPDGGYVEETTPPITTTLTGQAQDAIAYKLEEQVTVPRLGPIWVQIWSSGRFNADAADGVAFEYTIPHGYITKSGTSYRLTVWSYDTVDREATPGDPIYVAAVSTFTFQRSAVPAPVTGLTVTGSGPGALISFQRATQPDYFALRVDGTLHFDRIDSTACLVSAGNYEIAFYGTTPNQSHTYEVEAVVTDAGKLKHSQGNPVVTATPSVVGIWLADDSEAPYPAASPPTLVRIDGRESQDFTIGEQSNVYYAIGRRDPVTIVDAVRGLEGTISGIIRSDSNAYVDNFRWMKAPDQVGRTFRLIYAETNMPVQLGEAHLTPVPSGGVNQEYSVSVNVVQVGEFD